MGTTDRLPRVSFRSVIHWRLFQNRQTMNEKSRYATHQKDIGETSTPSHIRLKPIAELQTQKRTKVAVHFRGILNALLDDLEEKHVF